LSTVAGRGRDRAAEGRTAEVAARYGGRAVPLAELGGEGEDLLLLAVADPALPAVALTLAASRRSEKQRAAVALHTSGSQGASALAPLAPTGTCVGAFHPLKAFPRPLVNPAAATGVVFALDGEARALALGRRLAAAFGGVAVEVPESSRRLYHFAASLAAGGVVTLVALAAAIAGRLGLPAEVARGYLGLARGALGEVDAAAPAAGLTGPVARGDGDAVRAALGELTERVPEALPTTLEVARETLRRLAAAGPLTPEQEGLRAFLAAFPPHNA